VTAASQIKGNHPEQYQLVYAGVIAGMVVTVLIAFAVLRSAGPIAKSLVRPA
jgi:high-affinity Fe2+/Pb2+ permease